MEQALCPGANAVVISASSPPATNWPRAIDTFVLAYDEHDAKPYRRTYDGSPLRG
nr:hypothetical protein [Streptomyces sp. TLI_235]